MPFGLSEAIALEAGGSVIVSFVDILTRFASIL